MNVHARHSLGAVLALGLALFAASAASGRADETFLCEDGSSVTIGSDNRAAMQDHPCVKAWFADDRARQQAQAEQRAGSAGADVQPALHRYTVHRAVALRDLQSRPAYLAWSRSRTAQAGSSAHTSGTVVGANAASPPSPRLGVTIRVPVRRR
jgi:hypothetical protein